jgi:hypothetical protein
VYPGEFGEDPGIVGMITGFHESGS